MMCLVDDGVVGVANHWRCNTFGTAEDVGYAACGMASRNSILAAMTTGQQVLSPYILRGFLLSGMHAEIS
jgi:hypothetical protein